MLATGSIMSSDGGNRMSLLSDFTESAVTSLTGYSADYTVNRKIQYLEMLGQKR
jgi:hypothetical protein